MRLLPMCLATAGLASTLLAAEPSDVAIRGATVLTVASEPIEGATVLVREGKIAAVGTDVSVPPGVPVVEAAGRYLMPGIIDTHSHMGLWPWPDVQAHSDGNEYVDPLTPHVRAEDGIHLEDPAFARARAGGVTTVQVLPGSANLMGGYSAVLKLRPVNTLEEMRFEGAPPGMKMAFGENPKRIHEGLRTRMGNAALLRGAFARAREYGARWRQFREQADGPHPLPRPAWDPKLEALGEVLAGRIRLHVHCYRKDDLLTFLRVCDEFGVRIASFQHGLEAYKIAAELARRDIAVATWADWWGFKLEAWDGIPAGAGILADAGVRVNIHSDSADGIQRLYHEAAKAVGHGMGEEDALRALTLWPATMLGVEDRVGTIEVGKAADLALFRRHPFDVYTLVDRTYIDGRLVYRREGEGSSP